jgi:phytanoyl-CoA hydroxylase
VATLNVKQFKDDGFAVAKAFFSEDEVERVRSDAKDVFLAQLRRHRLVTTESPSEEEFEAALYDFFKLNLQDFINCGKQVQHLISLHKMSLDQRIEEVLRGELTFSSPNISTRPVLYFNSPFLAKEEVYWRVFPHQDWRSMQGSLDSVVLWVPLADIDVELGALEVVPGSHRLGLLTTEVVSSFGKVDRFNDADFVPIEVAQGDVLFFSSFLVHRSGTNISNSIRWSCHFRFNNLAEKTFVERGYPHPYLYKPQSDLISPGFPAPEMLDELFGGDLAE